MKLKYKVEENEYDLSFMNSRDENMFNHIIVNFFFMFFFIKPLFIHFF